MSNLLKVIKKIHETANHLELQIEGSEEVSRKAYLIALKDISKNLDVPGFRKGKIPREIVEKNIGIPYISQRAFESVFYDVLVDVSLQEKLEIVDVVKIDSYEVLPDKPLNIKLVVELKPEVTLGEYKRLKIKCKKNVYDKDEFFKQTLSKIANNLLTFKPVESRAVKEGDLLEIDYGAKFEDGSEVPNSNVSNFQVLLEKDKFLPDFVDNLIGVNLNETKEFEIIFPETYPKELAGKKAIFKVKVNKAEEKVIPEVDDDLAKKVGLEDLEQLKAKILVQMIEYQDASNKRDSENNLIEEILKQCKFDISKKMLDREVDYLLNDIRNQCEKNNIKWADFKSDEKNKELIEKSNEAARKRISIDLVLNAIGKVENLSVSKDELELELKKRISELGEKYKHLENDAKFKNSVEVVIQRNKAVDFLVNNNEILWEGENIIAPD